MFKKIAATLLLMIFVLSSITPVNARTLEAKPITDITKDWEISFSLPVGHSKENLQSLIYIVTDDNKKIDVSYSLSEDATKVSVFPKNPYHFDTKYKLVVSDELRSKSGTRLEESWVRPFSLQSTYIDSIEANYTALFTNVKVVSTNKQIGRMTVSLDGFPEEVDMKRDIGGQFSQGMVGLYKGALLKINVYDEHNSIVDTQYYTVK